ncbi:MAG TPA: FAD-binding protein, partial [Myxococcota bacterium]|nr:FAD-binding protein [Myxococcota bacterium]
AVRFEEGGRVVAESGANLSTLARRCMNQGLAGLEWAVNVPGTVGGAVINNAGAHGGDMAGSVRWVEILSLEDRPHVELWGVGQMRYGYRSSVLKGERGRYVVLAATLILEPGRFIIGPAGILVGEVQFVKQARDRRFVIVDAGMNDLIRPALYEAVHRIEPVADVAGAQSPADVVGPICESGDFLGKDRMLPPLVRGDLVAVFTAGAYGFAMSSNYNQRPRAAEVLVDGDRVALVRRRETWDDLLAPETDLPPPA